MTFAPLSTTATAGAATSTSTTSTLSSCSSTSATSQLGGSRPAPPSSPSLKSLSAFDIGSISTPALLLQTGYLTIRHSEPKDVHYRHLLAAIAPPPPEHDTQANDARQAAVHSLSDHLRAARFDQLQQSASVCFGSLPHDWHRNHELVRLRATTAPSSSPGSTAAASTLAPSRRPPEATWTWPC